MKRWIMVAAAAVALAAFSGVAQAGDYVWVTKHVKWKEVGAIATTDTTFLTDEADTVRTEAIDTSDWAWEALGPALDAGGIGHALIQFIATGANNGVSDSLYFTIEKGAGEPNGAGAIFKSQNADTFFTANTTIAAAVGAVALAPSASPNNRVFEGALVADPDGIGVNNLWLARKFRIRMAGDVSGTTPKLSGLVCVITYPKRAQAR